ncbi:MAG TPA: ATP-binding cassette domain-containing protein, partial [Nitriliruptorales bacterium]
LLGETLHDTIAYGTTASPDEVAVAGATVAAAPFIERMPLGYDTPLDDAPLSGGERQRLGLARAALQRTPILVLDDATSSLDTATEAQVHASLAELARGKTTIIVAHRASTAARADLVAWLADGRIRAVAPHLELWGDAGYQAVFRGPVGATTGGNGQPAGPPEVAP